MSIWQKEVPDKVAAWTLLLFGSVISGLFLLVVIIPMLDAAALPPPTFESATETRYIASEPSPAFAFEALPRLFVYKVLERREDVSNEYAMHQRALSVDSTLKIGAQVRVGFTHSKPYLGGDETDVALILTRSK